LVAWDFDHLLASQSSFEVFHDDLETSPQLDLSASYETYARERHAARAEQIKARRIERDLGPLRFVTHAADQVLLQKTLAWKSRQYLDNEKADLFALSWIRAAVIPFRSRHRSIKAFCRSPNRDVSATERSADLPQRDACTGTRFAPQFPE
jgi:hypothetical protein